MQGSQYNCGILKGDREEGLGGAVAGSLQRGKEMCVTL